MATEVKQVSNAKCFGGQQQVFEHASKELGCQMKFAIFLPSTASEAGAKLPTVYYLSGLTCNEQNMITKSGFQRYAEEHKLIVVCPDTSPRGCNVEGEDASWDIGTGAGFYVDATEEPWKKHYRMYSYITKELREVVEKNFACVDSARVGISGHSMGGHGALVAFFRNPQVYKAVSAFAPISNPSVSAWGIKCLTAYVGADKGAWKEYDATELVKAQPQKNVKILIDQGAKDEWLGHLIPHNFVDTCKQVGQPLEYNERDGYDHGYYFVSTFISNHMKYFSETLRA